MTRPANGRRRSANFVATTARTFGDVMRKLSDTLAERTMRPGRFRLVLEFDRSALTEDDLRRLDEALPGMAWYAIELADGQFITMDNSPSMKAGTA